MSNVAYITGFVLREYNDICNRRDELSAKVNELANLLITDDSMSPDEFSKLREQYKVIKKSIDRFDIEANILSKVKEVCVEANTIESARNNKFVYAGKVMKAIEEFMLINNMNLKDFAKKAKIPYTTLASKRSKGITKHKTSFINAVASVIGVEPNELMEG